MKLTNEQIEQILNDAPEGFEHYDLDFKVYTKVKDEKLCYFSSSGLLLESKHSRPMYYLSKESSRLHKRELEIMLKAGILESENQSLRKELELSNSILNAYREKSEKQSEYIKELEREAERGESGVNGVV